MRENFMLIEDRDDEDEDEDEDGDRGSRIELKLTI